MPLNPEAREVRQALSEAKRDWAGFIEGEQPSLSEGQLKWLAMRLGVEDDDEACKRTAVPLLVVDVWRQDPNFSAIEATAMGNKREGFRLLTSHLLPKALRRLDDLLDSANLKDVVKGITLLMRIQGMLADKVNLIDKDDLARLFERLREPVAITPLPGPTVDGEWTERAVRDDPGPS